MKALTGPRPSIKGFVLVGGASSRMGSNKAMLELGGAKLFERAAAALGPICTGKVTLVGEAAEEFTKHSALALNSIPDIRLHGEPSAKASLIGVYSALKCAVNGWAAILACDLPLVSNDLIEHLAAAISDDFDAVVPVQKDGRPQPLCAFYDVTGCVPEIEDLISGGNLKLQDLLSRMRVKFVPFEDVSHLGGARDFFVNINHPGDFERAQLIP